MRALSLPLRYTIEDGVANTLGPFDAAPHERAQTGEALQREHSLGAGLVGELRRHVAG